MAGQEQGEGASLPAFISKSSRNLPCLPAHEEKHLQQRHRPDERLTPDHLDVFNQPLVTPYAVGIDTGCVYGPALSAVLLPSWELVSVPARRSYRSGKDVALIPVHGDVSVFS